MPTQDSLRAHQQRKVSQLTPRQEAEQSGEHEAVTGREGGLGHLALQDRQLVPQHQDLDILVTIASRQQP